MKKIISVIVFFVLLTICAYAQLENETQTMTELSGELAPYAESAVSGKPFFREVWDYTSDLFFKEFKNISRNLPSLIVLMILFSLKNCIQTEKGIDQIISLSCICGAVILTSNVIETIFDTARKVCEALGTFVFTAIPCMCGAVAMSGMPVSAAKGAFIILGASNIFSLLINKIFFPCLYIVYILSVSTAMIENDIFESLKKTVMNIMKISLPFFCGIFTAILSVFMKTSGKADNFTVKSAKMTIGNLVPVLGSVLSDSAEVVVSSLGHIKAQLGIIGIFGLLSVLLLPIIKILCTAFMFKILEILCCFLSDEKSQKFYSEISETVCTLGGIVGAMAVMTLIGILILMG